jgi:hypothetical protein
MAIVKIAMLPADLDRTTDFVRTTVLLFLWNSCEVNVVIIAGCVPTIVPIFERLRGRDPLAGATRRRRLLFGKNLSFGATRETAGRKSARNQSYALSSKGAMGTTSSDEQWINDHEANLNARTTTVTAGQGDMEMARGIHVTRQINVSGGNAEKEVDVHIGHHH